MYFLNYFYVIIYFNTNSGRAGFMAVTQTYLKNVTVHLHLSESLLNFHSQCLLKSYFGMLNFHKAFRCVRSAFIFPKSLKMRREKWTLIGS